MLPKQTAPRQTVPNQAGNNARPAFLLQMLLGCLLVSAAAPGLTGCAHHYLPATMLESPEVRGDGTLGRVEALGLQSGPDLNATPLRVQTDDTGASPPTYQLQSTYLNPSLGFVKSFSDRWDIGLRMQAYAPLTFRAKYQLSGASESKADRGNIPISVAFGGGLLMGGGEPSTSYFAGQFMLTGGYRLNAKHLFSLAPFFTFGSITAATLATPTSTTAAAASGTAAASTSASASLYGLGLGYQYTLEALFLRGEISYLLGGSFGESKISGIYMGTMLGLNL